MSNYEKINLIDLNLFISRLESIDNKKICKEINDFSADIPYVKDPSPAHSFYEDRKYPFEKEECKKLFLTIQSKVTEILKKPMEITSIWTLSLENGQSVSAHTHKVNSQINPEEYYSISYYVNAPKDSADLIFSTNYCNTIENTTSISPQDGMLVVFNSYINHMTNRHYNIEPRIVVSANLSPSNFVPKIKPDWSSYSVPINYINM